MKIGQNGKLDKTENCIEITKLTNEKIHKMENCDSDLILK